VGFLAGLLGLGVTLAFGGSLAAPSIVSFLILVGLGWLGGLVGKKMSSRSWVIASRRPASAAPRELTAAEGQNRCQNPFKPRHRRWAEHRGEVVDGSLVGKASSPERQYERVNDDRNEQEQETSCDCGKTGAQDATHPDSLRTVVHTVARLSCSHSVLAMTRGPAETTVVSSR